MYVTSNFTVLIREILITMLIYFKIDGYLKTKKNGKVSSGRVSPVKTPMPVLFTCPHGGEDKLKGIPRRDCSKYPSICKEPCTKDSDLNTIELTNSIAKNIVNLSRREVYKKIALIDRSYIDFNRDPKCAFEESNDDLAAQKYREYHNGILKTIKEMYAQNKNGLRFLFDIHGTKRTKVGNRRVDIFFGTDKNEKKSKNSICGLLKLNPNALWDNTGLIKLLQDKGYYTYPRVSDQREFSKLDGGFTIKKYGNCSNKMRIESIQCEVSPLFRNDEHNREQFARDIAKCIVKFVSPYISK